MRVAFLCATIGLLAACTGKPSRYAWGSYEELIYVSYASPGKLTPELQIEQLEKDQLNAKSDGKPLPPGWHAQLGYLYASTGRIDEAVRELTAEKSNYPESTVFVDRLIANLGRAQ